MTETATGKQQSIQEQVALNRKLAEFDYDGIRNDPDLTPAAKLRRLEQVYNKAQARHKKLREEAEAERVRIKTKAHRRLTEPPIPRSAEEAEKETYMLSLRDAVDRSRAAVTNVKNPGEELRRLYEQATATGDKLLRYAAFRRAVESGLSADHLVVGSYLDEEGLREDFEIANKDDDDLLDRAFDSMGPPRPTELIGRTEAGRVDHSRR